METCQHGSPTSPQLARRPLSSAPRPSALEAQFGTVRSDLQDALACLCSERAVKELLALKLREVEARRLRRRGARVRCAPPGSVGHCGGRLRRTVRPQEELQAARQAQGQGSVTPGAQPRRHEASVAAGIAPSAAAAGLPEDGATPPPLPPTPAPPATTPTPTPTPPAPPAEDAAAVARLAAERKALSKEVKALRKQLAEKEKAIAAAEADASAARGDNAAAEMVTTLAPSIRLAQRA